MYKILSLIAGGLLFAGMLQGCATGPQGYGGYTPPPGYVLVPAPTGNAGYYYDQYDWDNGSYPASLRGNPFYMPYYWYNYAPLYYVRPQQPCKDCGSQAPGQPPAQPSTGAAAQPAVPRPFEPRGDYRIRRFGGQPVYHHVPEPHFVPRQPPAAGPSRAPAHVGRPVPQAGDQVPDITPVPPPRHRGAVHPGYQPPR